MTLPRLLALRARLRQRIERHQVRSDWPTVARYGRALTAVAAAIHHHQAARKATP
jgi:hypothetical protein